MTGWVSRMRAEIRKRRRGRDYSLWYGLPVVLGPVGGLVGYLVLRKGDPEKARKVLILGAVSLVMYGAVAPLVAWLILSARALG